MTRDIATAAAPHDSRRMAQRGQWRASTGLILLSLIPLLAGAARLTEQAGGAVASAHNARFLDSPVPIVTHILSVTVFSLLGAPFGPGDEVIAMLGSRFGGHAEYVCIPQDGAITAKPRNMTFTDSVTLVFGGTTAMLFSAAPRSNRAAPFS